MKVSEAVGEVSHKTNLETQTDMNQRTHSLSDAERKNSQELNLCTDKGVIEVSPKLVCCFKEGYHNIKDICIDEGFPVDEKCLIGHSETSKENPPSLLKFKVNEHGDRCTGGVRTGGYGLNDFSVDFKEKHNDHNMRFFLPKSKPIYDDDVDKLVIGGWPGPIKYIAYEKLLSTKTSEVSVNKNFEKPAVVDIDKGAEKEEHHQAFFFRLEFPYRCPSRKSGAMFSKRFYKSQIFCLFSFMFLFILTGGLQFAGASRFRACGRVLGIEVA